MRQDSPAATVLLRQAIGVVGAAAVLIGGFMLAAWFSGAAARWSTNTNTMKTNMALGLVLAGTALILLGLCPQVKACRWAGLAAATVILLLGSLTLSEHVAGWDVGIDQFLAKEPPQAVATASPNRMGPPGSASHALLGIGLLLLGAERRRSAPYLGLTVLVLNLIPAIGYLYGIGEFHNKPGLTGIAWPTVLAMCGLALGLILACPEDGPMAMLLRDDAGGALLRRMLPATLLLPLGLGLVKMVGQRQGLYDGSMGTAIFALAMMLVFSAALWRSATHLSRAWTARTMAGEALRQSEAKYRTLFENMTEEVHFWKLVRDESGQILTWRLVDANPPAIKSWGRGTIEELRGKTTDDIFGPGATEHYRAVVEKIMADGTPHCFEDYFSHLDRHFRFTSVPLGEHFITTGADITSIRKAELALRESERLYRAIGESIDYGIWVCDAEGRNTYTSESLLRLVGITREQCADFGWGNVLHPDDAEETIAAWKQCVQTGGPWYREHRYLGVDGRYHPILACGVPVRNEQGEITAWAGINLDISRLKQSEEALIAAKAALEHASAAKDHFIAKLSHELRTPLTPVVATLSALVRDARLPGDLCEDMKLIERNIGLEVHLINDLLDVTRIVNGKMDLRREPVDLAAVLREAGQIVATDLDARGQTLTINTPGAPFWANADRPRLHQVFWNLLKNAIKFSPDRGRIAVDAAAADGVVRIAVRDSGQGIDPAELPRLFRAFEQGGAAAGFGGLGLGLAICKGIVDLHGGTIAAVSEGKGHGATFTIELPLLNVAPTPTPAGPANAPPAAVGPLRILLVEDHEDSARIMRRLLASESHHVTWAASIREALTVVDSGSFDVLVSDIGLPDGTGYDLMRQLVAAGKPLKGIAVSGYGTAEDVQRALAAGFAEHVTKPVVFDTLHNALMRIVAGAVLSNK